MSLERSVILKARFALDDRLSECERFFMVKIGSCEIPFCRKIIYWVFLGIYILVFDNSSLVSFCRDVWSNDWFL